MGMVEYVVRGDDFGDARIGAAEDLNPFGLGLRGEDLGEALGNAWPLRLVVLLSASEFLREAEEAE